MVYIDRLDKRDKTLTGLENIGWYVVPFRRRYVFLQSVLMLHMCWSSVAAYIRPPGITKSPTEYWWWISVLEAATGVVVITKVKAPSPVTMVHFCTILLSTCFIWKSYRVWVYVDFYIVNIFLKESDAAL